MRHHIETQQAMALPALRPRLDRLARFVVDRFLLLPLGAAVAVVWANTDPERYFRFARAMDFPINEIAMAFFLGLMAQEVREAVMPGGALHTWKRWGLAVIGAAGGLAGAYAAYLMCVGLNNEGVLRQAWPIAGAVDVAAAYYIVKMVWRRSAALPFVLLLALAGDAAGVMILSARPQGSDAHPGGAVLLLGAIGVAALMRRRRVPGFWRYILICGPLAWLGLLVSRVHPAVALIPIVPFLPQAPRRLEFFADPHDTDGVHHFEQRWNAVVQVILFMFGLVNAGVALRGYDTGTYAVLAAALVGRPVGILTAVALAVAVGFHLPRHLGWRAMTVIALATSGGFTFALFFSVGLIPVGPLLAQLKIGALLSVTAAPLALGAARVFRLGRFAR